MERHGRLERQFKRLAIHHRQGARQAQRNGVGLRVGRQAEVGAAPGEHLALGLELNVDLQADDDFVVHGLVSSGRNKAVKSAKSSVAGTGTQHNLFLKVSVGNSIHPTLVNLLLASHGETEGEPDVSPRD